MQYEALAARNLRLGTSGRFENGTSGRFENIGAIASRARPPGNRVDFVSTQLRWPLSIFLSLSSPRSVELLLAPFPCPLGVWSYCSPRVPLGVCFLPPNPHFASPSTPSPQVSWSELAVARVERRGRHSAGRITWELAFAFAQALGHRGAASAPPLHSPSRRHEDQKDGRRGGSDSKRSRGAYYTGR